MAKKDLKEEKMLRESRVYRALKFTDAELEEIGKVVLSPFLREWLYLEKQ